METNAKQTKARTTEECLQLLLAGTPIVGDVLFVVGSKIIVRRPSGRL